MAHVFCKGETVVYGAQGVCTIVGVEERQFGEQPLEYYVLQPVFHPKSAIYVPVQNQTLTGRMRPALTADEVYAVIGEAAKQDSPWIADDSERRAQYQAVLSGGDRLQLMCMARTLYSRQKEQQAKGRRLHLADERILKEAETALCDEFALALHLQPEQVPEFIREQIETEGKSA